ASSGVFRLRRCRDSALTLPLLSDISAHPWCSPCPGWRRLFGRGVVEAYSFSTRSAIGASLRARPELNTAVGCCQAQPLHHTGQHRDSLVHGRALRFRVRSGAICEKVLLSTAWSATAGRMSASDRAPARPTHNVMDATEAKRQAVACLRV